MAVKAKAEITLATIRDVQSVTRYYLLQSSTSSIPSKPAVNPPTGSWGKTEPSYTSGSTNSLYFTDLTVFTDGSFSYSDVSLSSSYEAAKSAYNKAVAAEGTASTALAQSVEYIVGTQTAVTGNWTGVSVDGALYAGKTIAYKLPYAGSGNASLKLTLANGSETELIPVYLNTTRVTTHFGAGAVINMTFDGTAWRAASIPNSNNYDRRLHNSAIKAAAAVTAAHLIAGTADGYKMLAASLAFDLAYPILYASAAISANATAKSAYEAIPDVNFSTTGTLQSGAANKILWLKGTVEGNIFTIAASDWLTTVVPVEEDGMYYIPLGVMSSATAGYFASSDRLCAFVDDAFQPLDNASRKLAEKAREEVVDAEERVRTYTESAVSQKADEIEISISTVTGTLAAGIQDCQESIAQTDEALADSVDTLTQRISDQEDALLDYKHETSTYFRFNTDGLNIGKQEDGDESPYSINIDNEKMGFLQNGVEIAYVQYNKMHINAIEAMDRLSVGAAADGGYFDFISTEYGMGVKWRAVNQSNGASLNMMRVMAKKAAEYEAVRDEMSTLTMTGSVTNATTKLTIVYQATNSLWGVEGTINVYVDGTKQTCSWTTNKTDTVLGTTYKIKMTSQQLTINKPFFTLKLTDSADGSEIFNDTFSFYEIEKTPTSATTSGGVMDGATMSKVVFTTSGTDATYSATFSLGSYASTATTRFQMQQQVRRT